MTAASQALWAEVGEQLAVAASAGEGARAPIQQRRRRGFDPSAADGRAAVRAQITGTHRGALFGIAPTNKPIAIAIHEFHYLGADRITHTWHLEDWFGMLNQVGAWPPVL